MEKDVSVSGAAEDVPGFVSVAINHLCQGVYSLNRVSVEGGQDRFLTVSSV